MALPEIPEVGATGAAAAIYDQIRRESGSAVVNYIWRHLATIEGAAEWCWAVAQSTELSAQEAELSALADWLAEQQVDPSVLFPARPPVAAAITASYNRNNTINLLRVGYVISVLRQPGSAWDGRARPVAKEIADLALPALPAIGAMPLSARTALDAIAAAGPAADSDVLPSLWRHLSVIPGYLESLERPVVRILKSDSFRASWGALYRCAVAATPGSAPPVPEGLDVQATLAGLEAFSRRIAEMTLIGRVVDRHSAVTSG